MYKNIQILLRPKGKYSFLNKMPKNIKVLDVGCGKSPNRIKKLFPALHYTGIDIHDHFKGRENLSDVYLLVDKDDFVKEIKKCHEGYDFVISSHNIEHVEDRKSTLLATLGAVKGGGYLYLSFPSEFTVDFPNRWPTLNYYDDSTHKERPPEYDWVMKVLEENNFKILYATKRYSPPLLFTLGMLMEPISAITKKVYLGTMEFYGFETVIWARKC